MSRSSPSVQRVVAVLNLFADHPEQAFTLTDVIRALKLSRATCHSLLTGLVEAGYLYRATDKSYVLGAALLHVGEMAKAHFSPLKVAQPEMRALADEFGAVCSAAFRERQEVIVRERATAIALLSEQRGARLPLVPQLAGPFFVHASKGEMKAWVDGFDPPCAAPQIEAFYKSVEFVRAHGFLFCVRRQETDLEDSLWLENRAYLNTPMTPVFEIDDKQTYNYAFFVSPVFDANREVAFALSLSRLQGQGNGAEVRRIGARLRDACERITASMVRPAATRG